MIIEYPEGLSIADKQEALRKEKQSLLNQIQVAGDEAKEVKQSELQPKLTLIDQELNALEALKVQNLTVTFK